MKKKVLVLLLCGVALVSMLLTPTLIADAGLARKKKAIRCDIEITLNPDGPPTWYGEILRGNIKGDFEITLIGADFLDSDLQPDPNAVWEIYWEKWVITNDDGDTITVLQAGVWSFVTFEFRSNGPVVAATGKFAFLIGSTMYVSGKTNDPFSSDPVIGLGEMWIN
jgi:hypothetical protein